MTRLLALLLGALVVVVLSPPAAAHEGAGVIEVVDASSGEQAITYRVRVSFVADGHGAPEATVTATPVQDGAARTPVPLQATGDEGIYAGTVSFPGGGAWTVRFTSIRPSATTERSETITARTTAPSTTTTELSGDDPPPRAGDLPKDDNGATNATVVIVGLLLILAAAVAVLVLVRRRAASREQPS